MKAIHPSLAEISVSIGFGYSEDTLADMAKHEPYAANSYLQTFRNAILSARLPNDTTNSSTVGSITLMDFDRGALVYATALQIAISDRMRRVLRPRAFITEYVLTHMTAELGLAQPSLFEGSVSVYDAPRFVPLIRRQISDFPVFEPGLYSRIHQALTSPDANGINVTGIVAGAACLRLYYETAFPEL